MEKQTPYHKTYIIHFFQFEFVCVCRLWQS